MKACLDGLRVLDLSRILAGPWATQLLADLGAEVIKIERPGEGDDTRGWGPPFVTGKHDHDLFAAYYLAANRGKKSVGIDFSKPEGRDLVCELAKSCDVVVENFKVGGLKRLGLDYEALSALNPRLIYCSISGFGQTGPYKDKPGYDLLVQAMGGLMSITGRTDEGRRRRRRHLHRPLRHGRDPRQPQRTTDQRSRSAHRSRAARRADRDAR
jgi:crotonobetainyl-CoA:carnitine CoA-transferase CaiB-like acyl-CoA transferase